MVMATFDRITSKDPSYKKTVLLHSMVKPEVTPEGYVVITNTKDNNSGKLVAMTMHTDMTATVIGDGDGSEYDICGKSFKPDSYDPADPDYRIELSPKNEALTDRILTLMYVTDAENTHPVVSAEPVETDELMGAIILKRALLFAKNKGLLDGKLTFTLNTDSDLDCYVAGIASGEWQISVNDEPYTKAVAKDGDGVIRFNAPKGKITIELL